MLSGLSDDLHLNMVPTMLRWRNVSVESKQTNKCGVAILQQPSHLFS